MRVLIVQPWIRAGGAELLSLRLAQQLERAGDEAPIAALFLDRTGLPPDALARRFILPPRWLSGRFARSRLLTYSIGPIVLLALVIWSAGRVDVINPHNLPGPLVAAVASLVRRRPVVWTCNEVPEPLPRHQAARLGRLEAMAWRAGAALTTRAARVPREILVLSEKTRLAVQRTYGRDALVVRPGTEELPAAARSRPRAGPFELLLVAKLHPQKDPQLAVRSLAAVREAALDARLTIVGDGPERSSVLSLVAALGLDDVVRLETTLDAASLFELYRASDALLVTAGGHQSWGLTPFEALAAGTPSVISAEIGAAEVLGPAEAALIVRREARSFAEAILRLARDAGLRERLVANGRPVLADLTWERYAVGCRAAFSRAANPVDRARRR